MANGNKLQALQGLLGGGNPLFDVGVGLLAASGPRPVGTSNFGSRLAEGVQFASQRQRAAMETQMLREQLLAHQRQREQGSAIDQLIAGLAQPGEIPADGGYGPPQPTPAQLNPQQARLLQLMAQTDPNAALGIIAQRQGLLGETEPTGLAAKLQTVQGALGRELSEDEVLALAGGGGGTTINIGDSEAAKPIPTSQLQNIRLPDGSTPPLGTTFGEAQAAGARVFTADELKRAEQVDTALGVLTDLRELAVGEDGVFRGVPSNLLGRYATGVANGIGSLFGTQASERRTVFRDLSRGTIAPLVRSLGESGALSDGDVERALKLLPENGVLPTSGRLAEQKLEQLEAIFRRAADRLDSSSGGTGDRIDLGDGVTLTWDD